MFLLSNSSWLTNKQTNNKLTNQLTKQPTPIGILLEAKGSSASEEISRISLNPEVHTEFATS
jgi:hypothetical protein